MLQGKEHKHVISLEILNRSFLTLFNAFLATPQIFAVADSEYSEARGFSGGLGPNTPGVGGVARTTLLVSRLFSEYRAIFYVVH